MLFGIMKCLEKDQTNVCVRLYAISMPHVAISGDVIVKRNLAPACRLGGKILVSVHDWFKQVTHVSER